MKRARTGLLLGGCGSTVTWAASHHVTWTVAVGVVVAVLVWFGHLILDGLDDLL